MSATSEARPGESQRKYPRDILRLLEDQTPRNEIIRASIVGNLDRVLALLTAERSVVDVEVSGWTPLSLAMEYGREAIAVALIDHGACVEARDPGYSRTCLHVAVKQGSVKLIDLLLERGADPNALDRNQETPLYFTPFGAGDVARRLLQGGATPGVRNLADDSPLQIAASEGDYSVVEALLDHGADMNARHSRSYWAWNENPGEWPLLGETRSTRPLYSAACRGSIDLADLLLCAGADREALSFGWSALHAAAAMPDSAMVEFLLQRGANPNVKSADGRTPLEMLAGHRRSGQLLRAAMSR